MKFDSLEDYYYNHLLPIALEYGMSSKEFWEDDPNLFISYRIFYINKIKLRQEYDNNNNWLVGFYNYIGVQTAVSNAMRGKNDKPSQYLDEPVDFNGNIKKAKGNELKNRQEKNIAYFANLKKNGGE